MTPAANLPTVSLTPAANFSTSFASVVDSGDKFATGVNDTMGTGHWYQQHCQQICHHWQTMGTINELLTTLNELEEKNLSIC
jgi:hypothetical protein